MGKGLKQTFLQNVQMANEHVKRCSISLMIRKMARMWRNWDPVHCWWECKIVPSLWKIVWWLSLKILQTELPYGSVTPPLGHKWVFVHRVHSSIIHNSQKVEATHVWKGEWVDKENVAYAHNGM